jgi:hypothetical protein
MILPQNQSLEKSPLPLIWSVLSWRNWFWRREGDVHFFSYDILLSFLRFAVLSMESASLVCLASEMDLRGIWIEHNSGTCTVEEYNNQQLRVSTHHLLYQRILVSTVSLKK